MGTPVLLVTGTVGVGKTQIVREANELLRMAGVSNATMDLDWLAKGRPPAGAPPVDGKYGRADLAVENLRVMWPNYARRGIERLLLAGVIDRPADLDGIREAIPGMDLVVCRLVAPADVVQERIRERERGVARDFISELAVTYTAQFDAMTIEDFRVENGPGRSLTEVAREVLERSGWLPAP